MQSDQERVEAYHLFAVQGRHVGETAGGMGHRRRQEARLRAEFCIDLRAVPNHQSVRAHGRRSRDHRRPRERKIRAGHVLRRFERTSRLHEEQDA